MAAPDKKLSIRLSGGFTNRMLGEFIEPVPVQGSEPKLAASINTRLGKVPGGVTRSPAATQIADVNGFRRYGLIPAETGMKTTMTSSNGTNIDIVGDGTNGPGAPGVSPSSIGGPYAMATIADAGQFDGASSISSVAQVYDSTTQMIWRAQLTWSPATDNNTLGFVSLYVSATYPDGRLVSPMSLVSSWAALPTHVFWVGLTAHPNAGVFAWSLRNTADTAYGSTIPNGTGIYCTGVGIASYSGAVVARTTDVLVANPIDKTVTPDVIAVGEYAYVISGSDSVSTDALITRFLLVSAGAGSGTVNTVALPTTVNGKTRCALHRIADASGQAAVYSAVSREGGTPKTSVSRWSDVLVSSGAAIEVDYGGTVVIKRSYAGALVLVGSAPQNFTQASNAGASGFVVGTALYAFTLPSSAWASISTAPVANFYNLMPYSHGVEWTASDGSVHPIVFFVRRYGKSNVLPGNTDYVDDPCIIAYDLYQWSVAVPVARFASVRGTSNPVMTFSADDFASRSDVVLGDKMWCGWRKIGGYVSPPYDGIGRFTCIDMTPRQLSVANDKDGNALVACAWPASYDGGRVWTMGGPEFSPHLATWNAFDSSSPNAVFSFAAVFEIGDASGDDQRSRPSNIVTVTANVSSTLWLTATLPPALINRVVRVMFYASVANGTTLHLFHTSNGLGYGAFAIFDPTKISEANPQIYSTGTEGEELTPQPPPPLRDIAIIGQRAVAIDAEFPKRLPFSKLRVAGVGYEWFPAGEANLPSESGDGFACREWQGSWIVFAEKGTYQISGDGPNNNASAGSFYPPVKISSIGCTNTASVVEYPGGIMWQSGIRFARLSAGVTYDQNMLCTHDVSAAVCVPRYDEVWLFSNTIPEVRVYNYALDRWTTWDSETLPELITMARVLPWNRDQVLVYSEAAKSIKRIDADSISSAPHMTFETDWILADADFQSHIILREVVFSGAIAGPHSLELSIRTDYETTPSTFETWSSTELASIAVGGRYTVRKEVVQPNGRAFKIKLRDVVAPGEPNPAGVSTRALTLVFAREDGTLFEEVFNAVAFK